MESRNINIVPNMVSYGSKMFTTIELILTVKGLDLLFKLLELQSFFTVTLFISLCSPHKINDTFHV